jgi:aromatic-L-amino-acid decarboxylase
MAMSDSKQQSDPPRSFGMEAGGSAESDAQSLLGDMPPEEFRRFGYQVVDWLTEYQSHPERYRVQPDVRPGALVDSLPSSAPEQGEPMDLILADFERQILPHATHWNHPGFMGYFATTGSGPGILAEALTAGLNNIGHKIQLNLDLKD